MCQYSSKDGFATDWHLVHLGAFATGGAGVVFTEATAVTANGRISPQDLGIYKDEHIAYLRRITDFVRDNGAAVGIQLAHAGRKASTNTPWNGGGIVRPDEGGWTNVVAPSPIQFAENYLNPNELRVEDIAQITHAFRTAASRALEAGFDIVEVHCAHGYLLHEFLSPLSNQRTDRYGGSFENRARLTLEVTAAIRETWPANLPVFVRISATDWADGGWNLEESVQLASLLRDIGVDLIDCSSGGLVPHQKITIGPGYQVPFSRAVREQAKVPTAAVGLITDAAQAQEIVRSGSADIVLLAREMLRNPHWSLLAASTLGAQIEWPKQYERAKLRPIDVERRREKGSSA